MIVSQLCIALTVLPCVCQATSWPRKARGMPTSLCEQFDGWYAEYRVHFKHAAEGNRSQEARTKAALEASRLKKQANKALQ